MGVAGAFYVGLLDGLLGVAGMSTSDEMDHSRTFPAFSTSLVIIYYVLRNYGKL